MERGTEFDKTTCKVLGASRQPRLANVRANLTDKQTTDTQTTCKVLGASRYHRLATVRASLTDKQGGTGDPGTVLPKQHSPASHDPADRTHDLGLFGGWVQRHPPTGLHTNTHTHTHVYIYIYVLWFMLL